MAFAPFSFAVSVCFSIKAKEPETVPIEKRPAFVDESSDEEGQYDNFRPKST
jgi:hypothetical protein